MRTYIRTLIRSMYKCSKVKIVSILLNIANRNRSSSLCNDVKTERNFIASEFICNITLTNDDRKSKTSPLL